MIANLHESWRKIVKNECDQDYFKKLLAFVKSEYTQNHIFPPQEALFTAFNLTPFEEVKVVLIGQDPYHNFHQANGLSFSVSEGVAIPPSLQNIFRELENDLKIAPRQSGDLTDWARQGVLLLNATLSVRAHQPGSHQKIGWETFTDSIIQQISLQKNNVVFLLWGGNAQKKTKLIDATKHCVLTSGHPSPLSANRGYWFGNKHFSKTNNFLKSNNIPPISW